MPQFPIAPGHKIGEVVPLSVDDSKHLARILRAAEGEEVTLFDGTHRLLGKIITVGKITTVRIVKPLPSPTLHGEVNLAQALLKKDHMEFLVQKAVELGAAEFRPFRSERTIPTGENAIKIERWQKIADEALKQCGRIQPMRVWPVLGYAELLVKFSGEVEKIIFSGEELPPPNPLLTKGGAPIAFLIGPEGGFSEKEIQMAKENGYRSCSMGPLTLRAETAAIAALTLIQHELGNL